MRKVELSQSPEEAMGHQVFALIYQAGIANVFRIRTGNLGTWGRDARRIYQGSFIGAELFLRGILAGNPMALALSGACNLAGDIIDQNWNDELEDAPFRDKFNPVFKGYGVPQGWKDYIKGKRA